MKGRDTGEIFRVKPRRKWAGLNVYTFEDLKNEQVEGTFYESELQQVTVIAPRDSRFVYYY